MANSQSVGEREGQGSIEDSHGHTIRGLLTNKVTREKLKTNSRIRTCTNRR